MARNVLKFFIFFFQEGEQFIIFTFAYLINTENRHTQFVYTICIYNNNDEKSYPYSMSINNRSYDENSYHVGSGENIEQRFFPTLKDFQDKDGIGSKVQKSLTHLVWLFVVFYLIVFVLPLWMLCNDKGYTN